MHLAIICAENHHEKSTNIRLLVAKVVGHSNGVFCAQYISASSMFSVALLQRFTTTDYRVPSVFSPLFSHLERFS